MGTNRREFAALGSALGAALLALAACAGNPPRQTFANAQMAVAEAEEKQGYEYAPLEMRLSREQLASAEEAMEDEDWEEARRHAEKALVDAELAEARAEAARAQAATRTLRESVEGVSETDRSLEGGTR